MAVQYKSFRDRGVYVGFHGRMVELARCRMPRRTDLDDYEALIPNWAGSDMGRSNDLVMMFADLTRWTDLIGRDRLLHQRVMEGRAKYQGHLDPIMMRELRLAVDAEAGDATDKRQAAQEMRIAAQDVQSSFLEVLAMFGRRYGKMMGSRELASVDRRILLSLNEQSPDDMLRLVRIIVGTVVKGARISREKLQSRLDGLSEFAAPICSIVVEDSSRSVGYLSRQLQLLEALDEGIADYCGESTQEFRDAGEIITYNLQTFVEYALSRARHIKKAMLDESYYLDDKRYDGLLNLIREERIKISFALDGWASHATRWLTVDEDDIPARNAVIAYILRQMPAPPRELEEDPSVQYRRDRNPMQLRARTVREFHSWMDDTLDDEIYKRVMKSRNLATTWNRRADEPNADAGAVIEKAFSGEG
ncbi:hypothetical protein KAJ83_03150 [Marivibrio halodurans]|uniref:Uncharacterized protein n=1 Tax=Marivibrio halodurans TaxID=2039722 RepID=A0A8J7V166_9PROT|nr:hypothetical protein [Marivibrio halodurans]MBP5855990.1 hypothetical protein [Marivibrio halodurans]